MSKRTKRRYTSEDVLAWSRKKLTGKLPSGDIERARDVANEEIQTFHYLQGFGEAISLMESFGCIVPKNLSAEELVKRIREAASRACAKLLYRTGYPHVSI